MTYTGVIATTVGHELACDYLRTFGLTHCTCNTITAQLQRLQATTRRILDGDDGSPNSQMEAMLVARALLDVDHLDHAEAVTLASEWARADMGLTQPAVSISGVLRASTSAE